MTPLNRDLYMRLERYFGDVRIHNHSLANQWQTRWIQVGRDNRRVPRRFMDVAGETYVVRCKSCRDHRARLWINHRWGVIDAETNSLNLWLAHCFNEDCFSEYEEQRTLYENVVESIIFGSSKLNYVLPGRAPELQALRPVKWPGPVCRLTELDHRFPKHWALEYLRRRGFDPLKLDRYYDVRYCFRSDHNWAADRIIIPIYQSDMLVGWQARYIGDDIEGVPFSRAGVPKYYSCAGMPRRLMAYNLERALKHPTVVVVEGPTDVWRVGQMAVGMLGKTMSTQVLDLTVDGIRKHGSRGVVAVAFDAESGSQTNPRSACRPHPTDALVAQLRPRLSAFGAHVVPIRLPAKCDPGSMDRAAFRFLVTEQGRTAGAPVRFTRPPKAS